MMDGWDGGMSAGGWVLMAIFWIVLIGVIVWALVTVIGRGSGDGSREQVDLAEPPDEILDRRLASGEIDTDTYDALQTKLREAHAARG